MLGATFSWGGKGFTFERPQSDSICSPSHTHAHAIYLSKTPSVCDHISIHCVSGCGCLCPWVGRGLHKIRASNSHIHPPWVGHPLPNASWFRHWDHYDDDYAMLCHQSIHRSPQQTDRQTHTHTYIGVGSSSGLSLKNFCGSSSLAHSFQSPWTMKWDDKKFHPRKVKTQASSESLPFFPPFGGCCHPI